MASGQQTQALLPKSELKFEASFEGTYSAKSDSTGKKIIIVSPVFKALGEVPKSSLPSNVQPGDNFGMIQTIFTSRGKAWYNRPAIKSAGEAWSLPPNASLMTMQERVKAAVGGKPIPYRLLEWRLKDLPASDRDDTEDIFYDSPTTFSGNNDATRAALLGSSTMDRSVVKPELVDKPQDAYPLTTPCGAGRIYYLKGLFDATTWLVAMRGATVLHFFKHADWKLEYSGFLDDKNNFNGEYDHKVTATGPGRGRREPVIGGTRGNAFDQRLENVWSDLPSSYSYPLDGAPLDLM